jgi:hypothetical protein
MSFQTPPTFADGDVLSASQLNLLAANQNYLSGLASGVNPGFREVELSSASDWVYYSVIHAHDWLYVRAYGGSSLRVYTSADNFASAIATIDTSGGETEAAIDLSSAGLTKGAWLRYGLRGADSNTVIVRYCAEDSEDRTA